MGNESNKFELLDRELSGYRKDSGDVIRCCLRNYDTIIEALRLASKPQITVDMLNEAINNLAEQERPNEAEYADDNAELRAEQSAFYRVKAYLLGITRGRL